MGHQKDCWKSFGDWNMDLEMKIEALLETEATYSFMLSYVLDSLRCLSI